MSQSSDYPSSRLRAAAMLGMLVVHTVLLAWGAWRHSPTWTEVCHLPAGLSHWQLGNFDLYKVNPPLVRMIAAAPVLLANPKTDWHAYHDDPHAQAVWQFGREFMEANGYRSFWLMTLARWACIPFSLLGAYLCYRWACELHGGAAGLVAGALWCFSPNMIAHGQFITTDAAAATMGLAVFYLFWRWLQQPAWPRALALGAVLGLAELTRTTWVILFPLLPLLWAAWRCFEHNAAPRRQWAWEASQLFAILLLAVYVLNLGYGFEGAFQRLGDYQFISRTLSGSEENEAYTTSGNRFAGGWLAALPVPLPRNYVQGIDYQKWDFDDRPRESYLRGQWRDHGWWYYYLYALAVKGPLGTWTLVFLALGLALGSSHYRAAWRDEVLLLAPVILILVLVSSETGLNKHLRYVLPILPFVFILTSRVGRAVVRQNRPLVRVGAAALLWSAASSLWIYPHSLSYFNELAGGPRNGPAHLLASNISWGQDLLYLKRWYDAHPQARPLSATYDLSLVDPRIAGVQCTPPPYGPTRPDEAADELGPKPGWYAINVNSLHSPQQRLDYFLRFRPVDMVGYSTYVYHITLEEANRVRSQLGLPEVRASR